MHRRWKHSQCQVYRLRWREQLSPMPIKLFDMGPDAVVFGLMTFQTSETILPDMDLWIMITVPQKQRQEWPDVVVPSGRGLWWSSHWDLDTDDHFRKCYFKHWHFNVVNWVLSHLLPVFSPRSPRSPFSPLNPRSPRSPEDKTGQTNWKVTQTLTGPKINIKIQQKY